MIDLRPLVLDDVVTRVQAGLDTRLEPTGVIRKRRSLGYPTDRGTWVRIGAQPVDQLGRRGWNGIEMTAALSEVALPRWIAAVSWRDQARGLMWRADETEYVTARPVAVGANATTDPGLSDTWWTALGASLDALAAQPVPWAATQTTTLITQARITKTIDRVFPGLDTRIEEWTTAHGDLGWANLTAPEMVMIDWEDWGAAPRGLDAATLWRASLGVPALADRVRRERAADLDSRSGRLVTVFLLAELIEAPDYAGPLFGLAQAIASELVDTLT